VSITAVTVIALSMAGISVTSSLAMFVEISRLLPPDSDWPSITALREI
jgi:hypothetical protein